MAQKTLQVRLEAELYTTLDMLAARTGGDISKLTRSLLAAHAERELRVIQDVHAEMGGTLSPAEAEQILGENFSPNASLPEPVPSSTPAEPAVISRRPNLTPLFTTVTPGEANADEY